MGGGGGRPYQYDWSQEDVDQLKHDVKEVIRQDHKKAEINSAISERLIDINARDVEKTRQRLEEIREALGDDIVGIENLLFGGSVGRHTDVDGLSDVDSLILLDRADLAGRGPEPLREGFYDLLRRRLSFEEIESIDVGKMALTIRYIDGAEIQLLPAVRHGKRFAISSVSGKRWKKIKPAKFARELTKVNQANGNRVVPVIKLAKSAMRALPKELRLSGYHVEALAVAAFKGYSGGSSYREMITYLLKSTSRNVLRPVKDVTGQSRYIDDRWGPAGSAERKAAARALRGLASRMKDARTADQWRSIIDPPAV